MTNIADREIFGEEFLEKEIEEFKNFKQSAASSTAIMVEDANVMRQLFKWHFHNHYCYSVFTTDKAILDQFIDLFPKQSEKTWMPAAVYSGTFAGKFMLHPNRLQKFFMVPEDYHALIVYRMFWKRYEKFSEQIDKSVRDDDDD